MIDVQQRKIGKIGEACSSNVRDWIVSYASAICELVCVSVCECVCVCERESKRKNTERGQQLLETYRV